MERETIGKLSLEMFRVSMAWRCYFEQLETLSKSLASWLGTIGRKEVCYGLIIQILSFRYNFQRSFCVNTLFPIFTF
jgi:hypothetical protein